MRSRVYLFGFTPGLAGRELICEPRLLLTHPEYKEAASGATAEIP